jgi:uncharacterized protein (TIGR03790 family)
MKTALWLFAAAAFIAAGARASAVGIADRVVIVANANAPDSIAIAKHYADVRGVPRENIVALGMPVAETISWKEFVTTIWRPLEEILVKRGWIDAIPMDLFDDVGRRKYAVSGHRIAALITCRGVPLRIDNDPSLFKEVPPFTDHSEFRTNRGAVDSELSLLAQSDYPINASIPNPLFGNGHPTDGARAQVVEVSRLDGPSTDDAMHLVDLAVAAERTGLLGRAYVDIAGSYENGNRWLERTASIIDAMGFDLTTGRGPGTFPSAARIDAPVLYFGWYAQDLNGPFALPGFRFPAGAIAVHIHSYSAHTLRSRSEGWCGPFLARGVTATLGNVFEPYLEFLHRPDLFMEALARGDTLVSAAYYALPVLSWQSIVVGDPLYRPFATPLPDQLRGLSALPSQAAGYAIMREMNLLALDGKQGEAIALGKEGMKTAPNLALALALAGRLESAGNEEEADWTLQDATQNADTGYGNWDLLREAAEFLSAHKRSSEAIDVYRKLFEIDAIPAAIRTPLLEEARVAALQAGETAQAADWKQQVEQAAKKPPAP